MICFNRNIFEFLPDIEFFIEFYIESDDCLIESGDSLRKLSELVRDLRKLNTR